MVARLIEFGHPDPLSLTPRQALAYLSAHEANRGADLAGVASAVRMAQHAQKKDFMKYMREATKQ